MEVDTNNQVEETKTENNNNNNNNQVEQKNESVVEPIVYLSERYNKQLLNCVVNATKSSNQLPSSDEYEYALSYPQIKTRLRDLGKRTLRVIKKISDQQTQWMKLPQIQIRYGMDDEDMFDNIVDVLDAVYERADTCIDEAKGVGNKQKLFKKTLNNESQTQSSSSTAFNSTITIPRPQVLFQPPMDNSNNPWIPFPYRENPSAIKLDDDGKYPHPYQQEITSLQYLPEQLQKRQERIFLPLSETPLTFVNTLPLLESMITVLNSEREIAIDLEHHSLRSFRGFTCLMQISTRTQDFIVDTISLRSHIHLLKHIFIDPSIVKVMHGADMDIIWLQSDFDIYVVNLFDTGQASRVLDFSSFGLAHLLKFFCDVDADKKFQLADWRIRPLPQDMIEYARGDTHYLLYIYDRLTNQLLDHGNTFRNLLLTAYQNSAKVCLSKYEKDLWTADAHMKLYSKNNFFFTDKQLAVFAAVYRWRHTVARQEDESVRYVLPNYMLFNIGEAMPIDPMKLIALCSPTPPLVRINAHDICRVIQEAKANPSKFHKSTVDESEAENSSLKGTKNQQIPTPQKKQNVISNNNNNNEQTRSINRESDEILKAKEIVQKLEYRHREASLSSQQTNLLDAENVSKYVAFSFFNNLFDPIEENKISNESIEKAEKIKKSLMELAAIRHSFRASTVEDEDSENFEELSEHESGKISENESENTKENDKINTKMDSDDETDPNVLVLKGNFGLSRENKRRKQSKISYAANEFFVVEKDTEKENTKKIEKSQNEVLELDDDEEEEEEEAEEVDNEENKRKRKKEKTSEEEEEEEDEKEEGELIEEEEKVEQKIQPKKFEQKSPQKQQQQQKQQQKARESDNSFDFTSNYNRFNIRDKSQKKMRFKKQHGVSSKPSTIMSATFTDRHESSGSQWSKGN